jgi:hypothetical protein
LQTWDDKQVKDAAHAQNVFEAKRFLAHTYLTTKIDATAIQKTFGKEVPLQHLINKGVLRSWQHIRPKQEIHVNDMTKSESIGVSQVKNSTEALPVC